MCASCTGFFSLRARWLAGPHWRPIILPQKGHRRFWWQDFQTEIGQGVCRQTHPHSMAIPRPLTHGQDSRPLLLARVFTRSNTHPRTFSYREPLRRTQTHDSRSPPSHSLLYSPVCSNTQVPSGRGRDAGPVLVGAGPDSARAAPTPPAIRPLAHAPLPARPCLHQHPGVCAYGVLRTRGGSDSLAKFCAFFLVYGGRG